MAQLTHGGFSFFRLHILPLFHLLLPLPSLLIDLSHPSPQTLNPTYVSSAQLLAVGIFIHQSWLTGGRVTQYLRVDSLVSGATVLGTPD